MTMEMPRILGRRKRLWCCDDAPEDLATTAEALSEEDNPNYLTMRIEALVDEAEETTRLSNVSNGGDGDVFTCPGC